MTGYPVVRRIFRHRCSARTTTTGPATNSAISSHGCSVGTPNSDGRNAASTYTAHAHDQAQ
jgi:hypothetical protein